jgi:hypothetical protein
MTPALLAEAKNGSEPRAPLLFASIGAVVIDWRISSRAMLLPPRTSRRRRYWQLYADSARSIRTVPSSHGCIGSSSTRHAIGSERDLGGESSSGPRPLPTELGSQAFQRLSRTS